MARVRSRRSGSAATVMAIVALAGVGSACVGATPREEFVEEIRSRGGGLTAALALDAVAAVEEALGTTGLRVRVVSIDPAGALVTMEVRDPARLGNLDLWAVSGGDVRGPQAVRLSAQDDLDRDTYAIALVALDRLEAMADAALAAFDSDGAWVERVTIIPGDAGQGQPPALTMSLASPRARATAMFSADAELVEVVRQ